jgi:hypothetical protein
MKRLAVGLVLLGVVGWGSAARGEIGTVDAVPAATLLLPYFEVNLADPSGITTLFSINNASATAILAHVTLWTDQAIPTIAFDVYLTGYDVQTINVRDLFNGVLPVTADDGADPGDTVSNQGQLSQDINFPGSTGPCGSPATLYNQPDPTLPAKVDHMRRAHTGQASPIFGGRCSGANYGDNIVRGYITVDTVNSCNLLFPPDPGYFGGGGVATSQNVLWGDYFYVDSANNFAQGDNLVHLEACIPGNGFIGYVGNGAGQCPFAPGDYTFYGRYVAGLGSDQRESLATTFASRYLNGGAFSGGTDLVVWRDPKTTPTGPNGPFVCGLPGPSWFPLVQADVVAFDEQENPSDQCFQADNFPPAIGGVLPCFPLAAQRVSTQGGNVIATDMTIPFPFGWLFLNLNTTVAGGLFNPTAQAWVTPVMSAAGRFSVGFPAAQLDNANATFQSALPGGIFLLP